MSEALTVEQDPNVWQKIAGATYDIVTPANLLDAAGSVLVFDGANHIDEIRGVVEIAVGRGIDGVDGWFARWTKTASELGEIVDHSRDKIEMLWLLYKGVKSGAIPKYAAGIIGAQNSANVVLTAIAKNRGREIHASESGKRTMALQSASVLFYIAGHAFANEGYKEAADKFKMLADGALIASVPTGAWATLGYACDAGILLKKR